MGVTGAPGRWMWIAAVLVGVALHLPGLWTGFYADDFTHQWVLAGGDYGEHLEPWALYDFGTARGFADSTESFGGAPWWTSSDWRVRFFRPVTSVFLWGTDVAVGGAAVGHAAVGLVLFGVLLALLHALARRLGLGPRAAVVAVLVFAAEESSHLPVGWAANRNTLIEAVLGVAALLAVVGGRPTPRAGLVATLFAVLATGAKESGILFLGLVALALWSGGGVARRLAGLPLAAAGAFVVWWVVGGYGATSLFYPMPWEEPGVVGGRAGLLATVGVASLVGPSLVDLVVFHADRVLDLAVEHRALVVPAAVAGGLLLAATWGLIGAAARRAPRRGLLLVWFVLALASQSSAPPSDRLLFVPALPFVLLVASWLTRVDVGPRGRAVRVAFLTLLIPVSAGSLVLRQVTITRAAAEARDVAVQLAELAPEGGDVVLLDLPNALAGLSLAPAVQLLTGRDDVRPWPLQFGRGGSTVTRRDATTYEVRRESGRAFLSNPLERVFATFDERPGFGREFVRGPMRVRPLASSGAAPGRAGLPFFDAIELRFAVAPEEGGPRFAAWVDGRLEWVEVAVGAPVVVKGARSVAPLAP